MSVFQMAHNLTIEHPTEKDYIQPFTVMADKDPPSPSRGGDTRAFRRLWVKPANLRFDDAKRVNDGFKADYSH